MRKLRPLEITSILKSAKSEQKEGVDSVLASNESIEFAFVVGSAFADDSINTNFLSKNFNIPVRRK